jgi:hypothetical protein
MTVPSKDILKAVRGNRGNVTRTAKELKMNRTALERRISNNPKIRKIVEEERLSYREEKLDLAEEDLMRRLENGDWHATKYVLSTLGRDRGYVERQEFEETKETKQVFQIGETIIEF